MPEVSWVQQAPGCHFVLEALTWCHRREAQRCRLTANARRVADACDRSELMGARWIGVEADGDAGGDRGLIGGNFVGCHVVWVGEGLTS